MAPEDKNKDRGLGERAKDFVENIFNRDDDNDTAKNVPQASEQGPRDKGLGEYTRDFVENLTGRDNDDATPRAEGPRDKGLGEYTKDFVGNIFGRDNDDDKPNATAPRRDESMAETLRREASEAGDRARAEAQRGQQGSLADQLGDIAKDAAERARAQNQPQGQAQSGSIVDRLRQEADEAAQRARAQSGAAGQPSATPGKPAHNAEEQSELERLRNRVSELERERSIGGAASGQNQRSYTVVSGDTLRAIAQRFYGDEMKWKRIYEANRDSIKNPDLIYPGQTFKIPE